MLVEVTLVSLVAVNAVRIEKIEIIEAEDGWAGVMASDGSQRMVAHQADTSLHSSLTLSSGHHSSSHVYSGHQLISCNQYYQSINQSRITFNIQNTNWLNV